MKHFVAMRYCKKLHFNWQHPLTFVNVNKSSEVASSVREMHVTSLVRPSKKAWNTVASSGLQEDGRSLLTRRQARLLSRF
jgi:hypothetical protein